MNQLVTQLRYIVPILIGSLLNSVSLLAQSAASDSAFTTRTCLCQEIKPVKTEGQDNISVNDVAIIINQIVDKLPFTPVERAKFRAELQVVSVTCAQNARALRCSRTGPKAAGLIRYILYNNDFLNRLANNRRVQRPVSWTDYFILAHEVGHHYFNHTHTDTEGQPVSIGAVNDKKLLLPYIEKEKPNHINEFLADAAAVGVLFDMGASREDILFSFRQMIRNNFNLTATDTHPSSPSRLAQAERLWDAYTQKKLVFGARQARNFADDFYDEDARKRFAIMQERSFWTLQPHVEGFTAVNTDFQFGNQPVLADVKPSVGVMAQLSWKNWYLPHGADLALGASNQAFNTYTNVNGVDRTVEKFNVFWATIQPTYSLHRIGWRGWKGDTAYHDRKGWFASVGGTVRIPLKTSYINYATGQDTDSFNGLGATVSPVIRIGLEKWAMHLPFGKHRSSYQVYLTYSPVKLKFSSSPDAKGLIHQVGLGLSYVF